MDQEQQISLLDMAKIHWRAFAPMWIFPVFFLAGGTIADQIGHPEIFFWSITPLFFWVFFRASKPCRPKEKGYLKCIFWAIFFPLIIWGVAVYARHLLFPELK
ncbi:MAG: hypothetical protein Q8K92_22680 [Leadbetterella sp.]|nr:hypothetical protein [Leadbetterella sp.]